MARRGISVLDLLAPVVGPGSQNLVPHDIATALENLSVVQHTSTTSVGAHIHYGTLQSAQELGIPGMDKWVIKGSGLTQGLPFQLTLTRAPVPTLPTIEPTPTAWQLDLFFERLEIEIGNEILKPARREGGTAATPSYLVPVNSGKVKIVGTGAVRIASASGGGVAVTFVDAPDTFDPTTPTGAVAAVRFEPPCFFIGASEFGMTVDQLTYDGSTSYTPPAIVARGHTDDWRGIAISEATVFFPRNAPLLGDVSVGVRDVLLGSPAGIQGDLLVEFGHTPVSPTAVSFYEQDAAGETLLSVGTGASSVEVTLANPGPRQVRSKLTQSTLDGAQLSADWVLPGNRRESGSDVSAFAASAGDQLRVSPTLTTATPSETFKLNELTFTFKDPTPSGISFAPKIDALIGGHTYQNVVWVSGSADALRKAAIVFSCSASATIDTEIWELERSPDSQSTTGSSFNPVIPDDPDWYQVALHFNEHVRHCRVSVLADGEVFIGCAGGVYDTSPSQNPVLVKAVAATYDLRTFHERGVFSGAGAEATVAAGLPTVPSGSLALLTIGTAASPEVQRRYQIFMDFNQSDKAAIKKGGLYRAKTSTDPLGDMLAWAKGFTGASFYVIGHCDDIGTGGQLSSSTDSRGVNKTLAEQRAETVSTALTKAGLSDVHGRGEQDTWSSTGTTPFSFLAGWEVADSPDHSPWWEMVDGGYVDATELAKPSNKKDPYAGQSPPEVDPNGRWYFRRVDIFAAGGTAAPNAPAETHQDENTSPLFRFVAVPGADLPAVVAPNPREPTLPWRVRLLIRWDSPTAIALSDAIPTLAEVTIAWTSQHISIPNGTGGTAGDIKPYRDPTVINEVFTLVGRWAYDARSGQTVFSVSFDEQGDPDGLFKLVDGTTAVAKLVAATFGFGPALMAGIGAAGVDGKAARFSALAVAAAAITFVASSGKVVVFGISVEQRQRSLDDPIHGSRERVLFDYTVDLGFDASLPGAGVGIKTDPDPNKKGTMQIRYKNVGIQVDNTKTGIDRFGLVYENVSFEISRPGLWIIDGKLGEVLRVVATRAGAGSNWLEVDLAFVIDLGVINITNATVRLTFDQGTVNVELRGLGVAVDVAETVKGSGKLQLGAGGTFRAGLDVQIIPAGVEGLAALAFGPGNFFSLELGVMFAVGIPLASTGLGIYGFTGLFVSNGTRVLPTTPADPIGRELAWYQLDRPLKWQAKEGQWALGVGALVGTLPDTAFTLNALGALTVTFPDVEVIFGINAKFVDKPTLAVPEKGSAPATSFVLVGLVTIDKQAVSVGVKGTYNIPKLLTLKVPLAAYFPLPGNNADYYVRIGADGVEGRLGDPVTLQLLPDTLNLKAWAYLMVEQNKLHHLGGSDMSFDGFCVGFGAGWDVNWSAGPFKLTASAKLLVGFGTNPLMVMGLVDVSGELDLVVVSVSAHGSLTFELMDDFMHIHGELCGGVDCWFFSVSGCVGIDVGSSPSGAIPVPDPLITGLDLTDRRGIVTGKGATFIGGLGLGNTVWPDTVPVLHFAHRPTVDLTAPSAFAPGQPPAGTYWSGASELKYAYRVRAVTLSKVGSGLATTLPGPFDSVWWWPTHRDGVLGPNSPPPSEQEGSELALLSWHPAPWARNLGDDGANAPGDPSKTVGQLCDPPPAADPVCALGANSTRVSVDRVRMSPDAPSAPPFSSYFDVLGWEHLGAAGLDDVALELAEMGYHLVPGHRKALYQPLTIGGHAGAISQGYEIASAAHGPDFYSSLDFKGDLSTQVVSPELVLELCLPKSVPQPVQTCEDYSDLVIGSDLGPGFVHHTFSYRSLGNTHLFASDLVPPQRVPEISFSPAGLRIDLPQVADAASVDVAQFNGAGIVVIAIDATGVTIEQNYVQPAIGAVVHVELKGPRIQRIEIISRGGTIPSGGPITATGVPAPTSPTPPISTGTVTSVPALPGGLVVSPVGGIGAPVVTPIGGIAGTVGTGVVVTGGPGGGVTPPPASQLVLARLCVTVTASGSPWTTLATGTSAPSAPAPSTFGTTFGSPSIPSVVGTRADGTQDPWKPSLITTPQPGRTCAFVRYSAPNKGPWESVGINHWGGHITLVSVCGASWAAAQAHDDDQGNRNQVVATFNNQGVNATPRPLLEADTEYQIDVAYDWRGWRSAQGGDTPPALDSSNWTPAPTQLFRFRTAAQLATLPTDPPSFVDEQNFDPRGIARYIIDFVPDLHSAPHFLDDEVRVDLKVDHLEQLLDVYGRKLDLRIRRTDPPAGSLAGQTHAPNLPSAVTRKALKKKYLSASDQRIDAAAASTPCVQSPGNLGGSSIQVSVVLEPRAEYDLLLVAPPKTVPDSEDVLVARSHFKTSRYHGPAELLTALGFAMPGPAPLPPRDALVSTVLPTTADLESDQVLEQTLAAIGLEPWPLPTRPRTVALWRSTTTGWVLAGVLLEADEPIERKDRLTVSSLRAGSTPLAMVRSNGAGTRLLFAAPGPLPVGATDVLQIVLAPAEGPTVTAQAGLGGGPTMFLAESA